MATKPKGWPDIYDEWPAGNSNPAHDRDLAAERAAMIGQFAKRGLDRVHKGEFTREELLYLMAKISDNASDILRLMERNGAPTRPW